MDVFLVHHTAREGEDDENVKLIGVYASQSEADAAVDRARKLPGFAMYPAGFCVDRYTVGKDHWTTGFSSDP